VAEPIPFGNQQASGHEELGGASPVAHNVFVDGKGVVRRRPGLEAVFDSVVDAAGIEGLYETNGGQLFAVGGYPPQRRVYRVQPTGFVDLSATFGRTALVGASRPSFAETERLLVIAGGGHPQKVELETMTSERLGGTPPKSTHVVAHSNRLLLNDASVDRTKIQYSGVAIGTVTSEGHETWPVDDLIQAGYFTAEARPDPVVALGETTNYLWVFGSQTTQVMVPDGTYVFAPLTTLDHGCAAPHSIVRDQGSMAWLDHQRRFVMSSGGGAEIMSVAIQRALDELERVDDCFGYRVSTGPLDCMVWTFPSDGRTLVLQKGGGWSQWSSWDTVRTNWSAFAGTAHCLRADKTNVIGTGDGRIARLSLRAHTDLGAPINAHVITGFLDRGTNRRKHCAAVRLTLRRGNPGSEGVAGLLSWRDDFGDWGEPVPIELGVYPDTEPVLTFRSLGVYRHRQWRVQYTGTEDWSLVRADEEFRVLEE
jgi:hypothetical protein